MIHTASFKLSRCLLSLGLVTLLAGCAVAPEPRGARPAQATQAQQASAAGRYADAAQLWEEAAGLAQGQDRQTYRLRAAEAWSNAGKMSEAYAALAAIDARQLTPTDVSRYALLQAELALAGADVEKADFFLRVARPDLAADQQTRYRDLRARVERLRADPASYALATASNALAAMGGYETLKGVALLQLLEDVPSGVLEKTPAMDTGDLVLGGWQELALRMRRSLISGADPGNAAASWASEFPNHAVSGTEFMALGTAYRQLFSPPLEIAVLLPLEGGLAAAGMAIRDGLVSAYLENPQRARLRFYTTGDDPRSAVSAYFAAMDAGAQWIIGPLRRESVQALADLGSLGAPALVLNQVHNPVRTGADNLLFSLSLSQEEEARAIARKILNLGHNRAVTLAAENSWGGRMEKAFVEEFEAGEGNIVVSGRFASLESDHSGLLTRLLKIDESRDRKNRLQATVGLPLTFEPTRRDDFDVIFLAASPEQGRQIRPQLRFHDAGDKEVFAMGRIYSGELDPTADQDLNGINFPSTAWQRSAGQDIPIFFCLAVILVPAAIHPIQTTVQEIA